MRRSLFGFLFAALFPLAVLFLGIAAVPVRAALEVTVDGQSVAADRVALVSGRLALAADVLEEFGRATVTRSSTGVRITSAERVVEASFGSPEALVDGIAAALEAPFTVVNGTVMMPLRLAAEMGGWRVRFSPGVGRLELYSPSRPSLSGASSPTAGPREEGIATGSPSPSPRDSTEADPSLSFPNAEPLNGDGTDGPRADGPSPSVAPRELVGGADSPEPPGSVSMGGQASAEDSRTGTGGPQARSQDEAGGSEPLSASASEAGEGRGSGAADFAARRAALDEKRRRLMERIARTAIPRDEDRAQPAGDEPVPVDGGEPFPRENAAESDLHGGPREPASREDLSGAPSPSVRTVTGVTVDWSTGRPRIHIAADGPLSFTSHLLADPSRLVVDIPEAHWRGEPQRSVHPGPVVRRIRAGQHQPDSVRVVVDLDAPVRFDAAEGPQGLILSLYQQVGPVRVWQNHAGPVVDIVASGSLQPAVSTLREPYRLVVDLPGASLVTGAAEGEGPAPLIRRWRISQFQPDTVRLVLELTEPLAVRRTRFLPSDPDQPNGAGLPGYAGVFRLGLGPALKGVGLSRTPAGWAVIVEGEGALAANITRLTQPHRLAVDLPGAILPEDWEPLDVDGSAGVQRLRVARNRPDLVRLVVDMASPMAYRLFRSPEGERLVVLLHPSALAGRTIVLDPGHGGHDQGAIGVTGLLEAQVNLRLAHALGRRLDAEGARVYWTRREDVYVPLEQRADLANRLEADIFISIHNNSCPRDCTGTGSETYYLAKRWENELLASALQEELVRAIGLPDRGIKQRGLAVLRHSQVPAALVEVAFLSSLEEEALLRDDAFLERAVDGLLQGIRRYFADLASEPAPLPLALDGETRTAVGRLLEEGVAGADYVLGVGSTDRGDSSPVRAAGGGPGPDRGVPDSSSARAGADDGKGEAS